MTREFNDYNWAKKISPRKIFRYISLSPVRHIVRKDRSKID